VLKRRKPLIINDLLPHIEEHAASGPPISSAKSRVILEVAMENEQLEITPVDLKRRMDAGEPIVLIDVREPAEHALARVASAELIPMNSIPAHLERLEAEADESLLVAFCHHGVRSLNVVAWLRAQGVSNAVSLTGGIDRWATEIDQLIPHY
jgi:rhodanese-related sulfurtransferase